MMDLHKLYLTFIKFFIKDLLKQLENIFGMMTVVFIVLVEQYPCGRQVLAETSSVDETGIEVDDDSILDLDFSFFDQSCKVLFAVHENLNFLFLQLFLFDPQTQNERHGRAKVLLMVLFEDSHDDWTDILKGSDNLQCMKDSLADFRFCS